MFAFLRAMEFTKRDWAPLVEIAWDKAGNMPYMAPSVFGFFLVSYSPECLFNCML